MKTLVKFFSFAAVVAMAASPAARAYDGVDSSLSQGPGVYYGTGNSGTNHGWDVVTSGNVQLGLQALTPQVGPISPSGNNYSYTPGVGSGPGLAKWDFAFSVNTGSDPLSDYTYSLLVTDDTTSAFTSFDPSLIPDNGQSNGLTVVCTNNALCAFNGSNTGFQNAENPGFGAGFNPNAADTYTFKLTATLKSDPSNSTSVSINVVPTPEPSSLLLLGTGLASAAGTVLRRRRLA